MGIFLKNIQKDGRDRSCSVLKSDLTVFFIFFFIRLAYILIMGYRNNYSLADDSTWIMELSDKALRLDFDFDIGRFIAAPFYQCFVALLKAIFGNFWDISLVLSQLILSSLSGVFLYKLSGLLFNDKRVNIIAAAVFAVFPLTLWWVHTFATEMVFQSLLIFSIYFLVKSVKIKSLIALSYSAIFFSLGFLTKSHLLLFSPFVIIYLLLALKETRLKIRYLAIYASIAILFTLPFGLYNLEKHGIYVLSSNGAGYHFWVGYSDYRYGTTVSTGGQPKLEVVYYKGVRYDNAYLLPQKVKQAFFFKEGVKWIREHPKKFLELKLYDFTFFILPGVSCNHYPFMQSLFSFFIGLPVYLFGYSGIYLALKKDFRSHFWILGLFIAMFIFSVGFFVQNRFRTITLEPFYILYAAYGFIRFMDRFYRKTGNKYYAG